MKYYAITLSLVFPLMILAAPDVLMERLYDESSWRDVESTPEGIVIAEQEIEGIAVKAVKVSQVVDIDPEILAQVIEDVGSYADFLQSSPGVESELLAKNDEHIIALQYLNVPLISDRYYAFKMHRLDSTLSRITWELLPQNELGTFSINERSGVYIDVGVGSWSMYKQEDGKYSVSYRLVMDPGGWIPDSVSDYFNRVSIVGIFKDALLETDRRSSWNRG